VGGDRRSLAEEAAILSKDGYGFLLMDLPGHGMSGGSPTWNGPEREAVRLAVDWLSKQDGVNQERIGAYGLSVGSHVLTMAAANDLRIRAMVLAAASPSIEARIRVLHRRWGMPAALAASLPFLEVGTNPWHPALRDVIGTISPRPVLLIYGTEDGLVPEEQAHEVFMRTREPKQLEFFVTGHGQYATADPERYRTLLVSFFARNLLNKQSTKGN
jgi:pimeloyl-ACP methyl ester carboxylesterase